MVKRLISRPFQGTNRMVKFLVAFVVLVVVIVLIWFFAIKKACHETGDGWCLIVNDSTCLGTGQTDYKKMGVVTTTTQMRTDLKNAGFSLDGIANTGQPFSILQQKTGSLARFQLANAIFKSSPDIVLNVTEKGDFMFAFAVTMDASLKASGMQFVMDDIVKFTGVPGETKSFVYIPKARSDTGPTKSYCSSAIRIPETGGVTIPQPKLPTSGSPSP